MLKPGQRLVSREGDFWRWDGFAVAAHAPTGAARRLAERGRLQAIESELAAARERRRGKRGIVDAAEAALNAAAAAETEARARWREAQHRTDAAREHHAAAEREISRNAARISALQEAQPAHRRRPRRTRSPARSRERRSPPCRPPPRSKASSPPSTAPSPRERTACAEVRGEAQAIAREAELANHRLRAIAAERQDWNDRKDNAAAQIATLEQRTDGGGQRTRRARTTRRRNSQAQRQALIGEIETATGRTPRRRRSAGGRPRPISPRPTRPRASRSEAVGEARAEAARARSATTPPSAGSPISSTKSARCSQVEPAAAAEVAELKPDAETPSIAEVEAKIERIKQERERLGSVNLLAEQELREVEEQHQQAHRASATTWSRRSAGCARASTASTTKRASGC